jgi:hypothetical protein
LTPPIRDDRWLPFGPRPPRRGEPFLWLLCLLLVIYAVMGKAGAYLGIPLGGGTTIFIGDLVLAFGLAASLFGGMWQRFFSLPLAWVWLLFAIWNAAQTFPYISDYGLDALRDGATWGYSLFAVILGSQLIARPSGFVILLNRCRRFARVYVYYVLILALVLILFPNSEFGSELEGPAGGLVHVIGMVGIVAAGLVSVPAAWWWAASIEALVIATTGRSILLAVLVGIAVLRLCNPWGARFGTRTVVLLGVLGPAVAVMAMLHLNLGVISSGREISPGQMIENLVGTFADTEAESNDLDETRAWRLDVWNKIIDYTVYGSYFWTGKGYGINLLKDAGVSTNETMLARHPENSHLTFLARSGVPGFVLWVVLQATWAVGILRVLFFARRTGRHRTTGLMAFFLAYWSVILTLAGGGPVIETPHEGIWFWTIFGVGAAAAQTVRRDADFFERMEFDAAVAKWSRSAASARPILPTQFT